MKNFATTLIAFFLTTTTAFADEAARIEILHMWRTDSEQKALTAFKQPIIEQGVDWYDYATENNFQGIQSEYSSRLSIGDPPTVVHWIVGEEMKNLAETGVFRMINLDTKQESRLRPEVVEVIGTEDGFAGLPVGIHTQNFIVYNKTIADSQQLKIPATWDELLNYGPTLAEQKIYLLAASNETWQQRKLFVAILSSLLSPAEFREVMTPGSPVSHLKTKFEAAFRILNGLKKYSNPDDDAKPWEDATKMVSDGQAFAQILGDYIVPELDNIDEIICAGVPAANFIVWGMDGFALTSIDDPEVIAGQDRLIQTVLNPKHAAEYIIRKGGVPVSTDVNMKDLDVCAKTIVKNWSRTESRIWTGGDVWKKRFSAMAAVVKTEWDAGVIDEKKAAQRLIDVLRAL